MAIVEMNRLKLIGLKQERNTIMNVLTRSAQFEIMPTTQIENVSKVSDTAHLDKILAKQAKVAFGINFLSSQQNELIQAMEKNEKQVKKNGAEPLNIDYVLTKTSSARSIINYDDFYDAAAREYELLSVIDALEKISFNKLDVKTQISKLENQNKNMKIFIDCPLKFTDIKDTKYTCNLIYSISAKHNINFSVLKQKFIDCFYEVYENNYGTCIAVVCKIGDKQNMMSAISEIGLASCNYHYDETADNIVKENNLNIEKLEKENFNLTLSALEYEKYLKELKILFDFMQMEVEKSRAELDFLNTRDTFILEGWIPKDAAEYILMEIKSKTDRVVTYLYDVEEDEEPPTLLRSKKIMKPFEDITNMYSTPNYREVDPNPFMAIFFFIFFGMMVADAGYGLVLSLVATIALSFFKFEKGMKNLILLIGIGGLSAIACGVLFGGYFSVEGMPALWFNPIENPLAMLAVSLCIGAVQLMVGYGIKAYSLIKKGKILSAIFDVLFIYTLFISIGLLIIGMVLTPSNGIVAAVGMWMLVGTLVGILLTAGHAKKGILNKIMGGFAGLYGLINLFSDVLSYARLFGLALASGAIGLAFNILGGMLFAIPYIGIPLGIILLVPLHAFNLGIGVLGAYVHNARLQFLEFYGKFYEGNGKLFNPMGLNTKYIRFS